MKIAINCIYYTKKGGGITEYIFNLVRELVNNDDNAHDLVFYVTKPYLEEFQELVKNNYLVKTFPYTENQKLKRSLLQQNFWKREELIEKFDLFHSPFFHAPKFKHARTILTVHDLRFKKYPESYTYLRLQYLKKVVKKSIKKADHIITISEFTKAEIVKYYKKSALKISVIHEAVNKSGFELIKNPCTLELNDQIHRNKFLLAVGHLEPRKNYLSLIKSYSLLSEELQEHYKLVIVGKTNHDYESILEAINTNKNIIYLNFIDRMDLIWLYANCKLHVFPSIYEGFGFPILEAGMFGKPTLGSNQASIPEITGEGGIFYDPFDIKNITEVLTQVLTEEKTYSSLSIKAMENVGRFSWKRNSDLTIEVYDQFSSHY